MRLKHKNKPDTSLDAQIVCMVYILIIYIVHIKLSSKKSKQNKKNNNTKNPWCKQAYFWPFVAVIHQSSD